MAGRQPINIRRLTTTVGTSSDTAKTFVSNVEGEIRGEMSNIFQDAKGRLLIVGVPGSGKTTLLLRWIDELLDTEKDDLPVLVNLATWHSGFVDFQAWLQEILPAELNINKAFAKELLAQDRLLLLCDGLDEVREADRESLLAAIGKYGARRERKYVITSRIEEYKEVAKDAPVYLEIEVCPLTIEQLETELKNEIYDPEGAHLLVAIQKDEHLRQAIRTPFYFNALQVLFANWIQWKDLKFKARSRKGREEEIKRQFISFVLSDTAGRSYDYFKWLSFLAFKLDRKNLVLFELTDFQYDWGAWHTDDLRKGNFIYGMVRGLTFSLVFGLIVGVFFCLTISLTIGIVVGMVLILVGGLAIGLNRIFTKGIIKGLCGGLALGLSFGLVSGLSFGLVSGLSSGLITGVIFGLIFLQADSNPFDFPTIFTRDNFHFTWKSFLAHYKKSLSRDLWLSIIIGLLLGLAEEASEGMLLGSLIGLIAGLVLGMVRAFVNLIRSEISHFIQITHPYQRFKGSAKALYFSILQHWHLFHLFNKHGLLPKKIVSFLDEMTRLHILESDGASWRFRHRILQDYFAEQWIEPEEVGNTAS